MIRPSLSFLVAVIWRLLSLMRTATPFPAVAAFVVELKIAAPGAHSAVQIGSFSILLCVS